MAQHTPTVSIKEVRCPQCKIYTDNMTRTEQCSQYYQSEYTCLTCKPNHKFTRYYCYQPDCTSLIRTPPNKTNYQLSELINPSDNSPVTVYDNKAFCCSSCAGTYRMLRDMQSRQA